MTICNHQLIWSDPDDDCAPVHFFCSQELGHPGPHVETGMLHRRVPFVMAWWAALEPMPPEPEIRHEMVRSDN